MATITTINATDALTDSRAVINTNFANLNSDKIETSVIDTDTSLTANSDSKLPSQKAVKAYVDSVGTVNASESTRGVTEEATDAEVTAGTATGSTGAKLFITPEKFLTYLTSWVVGLAPKSAIFSTIFEASGRYTSLASGGTNTYDTTGLKMDTTVTTTRCAGVTAQVGGTGNNLLTGSPVFTATFAVTTTSFNFDAYLGVGAITVAGTGHTFTGDHCGFKILTSGGVASLYATQADGTTETASSALTTLTTSDTLDVMLKMNASSSIDYYYRKNGGSWSSATRLSNNLPDTAVYRLQASLSNISTGQQTVMSVSAMSYSR